VTYFILFSTLIILSVAIFFMVRDILSPSFIYACSMVLTVLSSIIGLLFWNNVYVLDIRTIAIVIVSVVSFAIGEIIIRKIIKVSNDKKEFETKIYDVKWWKIIAQMFFLIITIIGMYSEVRRIAISVGFEGGTIGKMIGTYRDASTLFSTDLIEKKQNINIIVSQMRKICEAICFINIYFLVNNIVCGKIKCKKNLAYIGIILLAIVLSILTAGRMQILIYIISGVFYFAVLELRKMKAKEFIKKYLKYIGLTAIVSLVCFCMILPLSGRKLNSNVFSYLSYYFGISIPSLDNYVKGDIEKPKFFGEETLRGIQTVAYKLHLTDFIQPTSKEWMAFQSKDGNVYYSNVFTSAKRYYHDFGWIGIVICQLIFSMTITTLYLLMFRFNNPLLLVLLGSYYFIVIDQVRDEWFFSEFIHINTLIRFVMILIIYYFCDGDIKDIVKRLKWKKEEQISQ